MSTANRILAELEAAEGNFLSGEELAYRLDVSRTAIWKGAHALMRDGVRLEARHGAGYALKGEADGLSERGIARYLTAPIFDVKLYKSVTSTNTVAKEAAAKGASEGTVIVAKGQTMGKGRLQRNFFSPEGSGAYFSIVLRPKFSYEYASMLTVLAAVAVAEGIEDAGGKRTAIKWVNDVYVDGKKCCGILTEAVSDLESGGLQYAVVGIGINVRRPEGGYAELEDVATSALDGVKDGANRVVAAVLNRFYELYSDFDCARIAERYRAKCFVPGRRVTVIDGDERREALALCVDDKCRLVVRYDDGSQATLSHGEVSLQCAKERE